MHSLSNMHALFRDRIDAGQKLAISIEQVLKNKLSDVSIAWNELIVLAIPRGGIILAEIIASYFNCDLDILVTRKIRYEMNEEFAIGAVLPDGSYFLNDNVVKSIPISQRYLNQEIEIQKNEIERRLLEFRGTISYDDKLNNKIVILVDDGIATGSTIVAAAKWLKHNYNYKKLVIAVPVAPAESEVINRLDTIADALIILYSPRQFSAVGQFYEEFDQVSDSEVKKIMKTYGYDI
ncbi:MAG TPA: phosphoribosyltransferase family protein [Nitrososphaeraceae archaeon]|nr:phosphoribosyltransferase family protein [Nitrososphaeraceae archaeon]